MAACERCWAEYRRRRLCDDPHITYSEVVAERERTHGGCSPEEQCGEIHCVVGASCRCGKVRAADGAGGRPMTHPHERPMSEEKDLSGLPDTAPGWRIDIHSAMSDGDGIRFEIDVEHGPCCAVTKLTLQKSEEDPGVVDSEFICQWSDLENLAYELETVVIMIRRTAERNRRVANAASDRG